MSARGQGNEKNYEEQWKKVEGYVKEGLPRSALGEVQKIYELAVKDRQPAQRVKALLYISGLQRDTREDDFPLSVGELEREIAGAEDPEKSLLYSILAEKYLRYFQRQRWKIYNRTATGGGSGNDPDTWSVSDFHEKISHLYLHSLRSRALLQQTELGRFEPVLIPGNTRALRPTLYDFLVHRALEYFMSEESQLSRPAYQFRIDQAEAFSGAPAFSSWRIAARDTLSLKYTALTLFRELLAFHQADARPDALIDADLQRLQFVYEHSVHPAKDSLYTAALKRLTARYGSHPAAAQAWYLLASWHHVKAGTYQPHGDTTFRFDAAKALEICRKVVRDNPDTEGGRNAFNLIGRITAKSLTGDIERVNLPEVPFRMSVDFRNVDRLHLSVIRLDSGSEEQPGNLYDSRVRTRLLKQAPVRFWEQALPDPHDYQHHRAEIRVEGLPVGDYVLVASSHADPEDSSAAIMMSVFHVSAISFVNNGRDYFVLHRDTGLPLAGAVVQVWHNVYDNLRSATVKEKGARYVADANGMFRLKQETQRAGNRNFMLEIVHRKDRLFMNEQLYDYIEARPAKNERRRVFFFTDRGIYRPGQTLYFKGIVLKEGARQAQVLTAQKVTVVLRNANFEEVDSLRLTTGSFGSVSGEFRLPASGLTGNFSLYVKESDGEAYFRVEEYKRPTFFVEYDSLRSSYALNDRVEVSGRAEAYAGNRMAGAKVVYRVVREPRFPYPWVFARWWQPRSGPVEIAHGEVTTDETGRFTIGFEALPDLSVKKELEPVFDYRIYTDATDESGETRSAQKVVSIGYKALILDVTLPGRAGVNAPGTLKVRTGNLAGLPLSAPVKVRISRLKPGDRLIRDRYWPRPDVFVMSGADYLRDFPHDEYDNERAPETFPVDAVVLEASRHTGKDGGGEVDLKELPGPGMYPVEVTATDKNGLEVKDVRYMDLEGPVTKSGEERLQYIYADGSRPVTPGQKTTVRLGTHARNVHVIQALEYSQARPAATAGGPVYTYFKLSESARSVPFPATEADRGG